MADEKKLLETIEEAKNAVAIFKKDYDEALANGEEKSAATALKVEQMSADILKGMDAQAELDTKLKKLEALSINIPGTTEEKASEISEHFKEFAQKGGHAHFDEYLVQKGLDIKTMSVDSDPDGGYLVLPTYDKMRKTREFETSPMRQLANVMSISSDRLIFPVDQDEATSGGWVSEQASRSNTDTPEIKEIEIPLHEQYANPKTTQKLLDMASFNVEQWLSNKVTNIISRTENTSFISGTGVGKPRGILTYDAWTTNGTYEFGKVEQINSGVADNFSSDGIIDLQNSLLEIYQGRANFLIKRASFKNILKLKTGDGEYLFNRSLEKNAGRPFDLLGAPVVFANDMPVVAANALAMAYGDFNAGYQIVDGKGIRVLRDPYSSKPYIQFYTTKFTGGDVYNFEAFKIQKLSA